MLNFFRKYFVIFAHFEFILMLTGLFGMHFYHVKIIVVLGLVYMLQYRPNLLEYIFQKINFYDDVILCMMNKAAKLVGAEFLIAKNKINKKTE